MTNKTILTVCLSITIIHFIATSVIGRYITAQVGTQMGKIVAEGLIETSDNSPNKAKEGATRIYRNMESKGYDNKESWKIPELLISLPARLLITPLLKDMRMQQMNKVIAKKTTLEQFRTQGLMIDYAVNFLNSLSLGFLVYVGLRLLYRYNR